MTARTLDSYDWPRLDFIKIDVEGLVLRVLDGAQRALDQFHPRVLTEVGDNLTLFGDTTADVVTFMASHGYCQEAFPPTEHPDELVNDHQSDILFIYHG